jgi:alpha-beta hydrolase superfamily lysophospholipase
MLHQEFHIDATDGIKLYAQHLAPEAEPKAVICLLHGLGEHSARYSHVIRALTQAGYALITFDLRGHGRSGGPRGHTPSSDSFLYDIDRLLAEAGRRYPGKPCFIYGHSLGGLLALFYTLRRKPELAGVVTTGAGLKTPLIKQKLKVIFAKTFARVYPTMTLPTGLDPALLSHDPQVVKAYRDDPWVHDKASLAMASSSIQAIEWTMERAAEFAHPLFMLHGTDDQLTYPSGSQEFAQQVRGACTLRLWDGLYHEMHNEPEGDQVIGEIIQWLDHQLGSSKY